MQIDGIQLSEGADIENLTAPVGSSFPAYANAGELFFKTGDGLYVHNGSVWSLIGGNNTASAITFSPYGNISSINVQTAIQELDDEKASLTLNNTLSGNNIITFADGAENTPSIKFAGDTTSGWYQPSSNVWALSISGSEMFRAIAGRLVLGSKTDDGSNILQVTGDEALTGNLSFIGNNRKILGDFTSSSYLVRTIFQTSATNGITNISAVPTGSATASYFSTFSSSDADNASMTRIATINGSYGVIEAGKTGTGSYLPLIIMTNNAEAFRINTSGAISVGSSGTAFGTSGQVLTSNGSSAAPTWAAIPAPSLTSTYIGYGNTSNQLTGNSGFTYNPTTGVLTLSSASFATALTTGISLVAPSSSSGGNGSAAQIIGGAGTSGSGGEARLYGGDSSSSSGGSAKLISGSGATSGGPVVIQGGVGTSSTGGPIQITGGTGLSGGSIVFTGGSASSSSANNGGSIQALAGQAGNGKTAGNIELAAGTTMNGAGDGGYIGLSTGLSSTVERLRILANGAWSVGSAGNNTGTSGQALVSNGSGSAPTWQNVNATTVDGYDTSQTNTPSTIAVRDSSGQLVASTPSAGDNSTLVATTAFVQNAVSDALAYAIAFS